MNRAGGRVVHVVSVCDASVHTTARSGLSPRNRVFIFCFVLVAVFFVTVVVRLGESEPSWLWVFFWSMLCVLPITCRLKSELPALSSRLSWLSLRTSPLRGEEVALAALLLGAIIYAGVEGSFVKAGELFADFFGSIAFAMGAELVSLIWKVCHFPSPSRGQVPRLGGTFDCLLGGALSLPSKNEVLRWQYFFCALCCRCCLPHGQSPGETLPPCLNKMRRPVSAPSTSPHQHDVMKTRCLYDARRLPSAVPCIWATPHSDHCGWEQGIPATRAQRFSCEASSTRSKQRSHRGCKSDPLGEGCRVGKTATCRRLGTDALLISARAHMAMTR